MDLMTLFEAPITHWTVDPDFDRNEAEMISDLPDHRDDLRHYGVADKAAIRDKSVMVAAQRAFGRSPVKFSLYFWQSVEPNYDRFAFRGKVDDDWMQHRLGEQTAHAIRSQTGPDTIGIVMTNNLSDEHKISLKSPWMIAHRIAHALFGERRNQDGWVIVHMFERFLRKLLTVGYGLNWPDEDTGFGRMIAQEYSECYGKLMGHTIGTMGSARKGALVSNWEWFYETFAQYLITGKVTLNPLPEHFDEDLDLTSDPRKRYKVQRAWEQFPDKIAEAFDAMLKKSAGSVFVM